MTRRRRCDRIVLPQAVKRMIPAFIERSIELMKTTTLVATIAYADLLYRRQRDRAEDLSAARNLHRGGADLFRRDLGLQPARPAVERRLAVGGEFDGALMQAWDFTSVFANSDALMVGRHRHAAPLRDLPGPGARPRPAGRARPLCPQPWFNWPATVFVEFFRNTPVLVQILWFYFALPILRALRDQPA